MAYTISAIDTATVRSLYNSNPVILSKVDSSALHFGFIYAVSGSNRDERRIVTDDTSSGIRGWISGVLVNEITLLTAGDYVELMYDLTSNVWQVTARHTST